MKDFKLKTFADLSTENLYQILKLRNQVFVLEQACPYQDSDDLDQDALHLYKKNDTQQIIAYARILSPSQLMNTSNTSYCSIGRVVVEKNHRQQHLGYKLMKTAIQTCLSNFPDHDLKISAQSYLSQFYKNLGFTNTGAYYLEDSIPHQEMIYQH